MRAARAFLIFSFGLFTIAAQTLLFREFITTFEGNDISVGIFFGSWFLWVGLAALLVNKVKAVADKLLKNIEFLFLCYLPVFILQAVLIIQARELTGVEIYELLSIRAVLLLSIVINAPVSIITGMLFPIACRWVREDQKLPVSLVYILEAAGSLSGGLAATVLLGFGISSAAIFFLLAFIVSLSVFFVQLAKAKRWLWALVPVCALACLVAGADRALMQKMQLLKWDKLFPGNVPDGSFRTAQAEYLYGFYQDQWVVVREGSTCEVLPGESSAGRIAAIGLCQNPDAGRILVVGSGLGLCYEFLRLPQTEVITWAHCDNEYVQMVDGFIPPKFKITNERLESSTVDVRSLLDKKKQYYDIAIINLPDATSSVLNRYYTLEFYRQVKEALRPGGVLQVRVAGGENILGTELINLGASTKLTLEEVFSQFVLTPGEETWFIVSDSEELTSNPGTLRDRFASIEGGKGIFPPEALLSVYLPDRTATALESYSSVDLPEELLVNRDSKPLTHLYSLLLAAKQSEAPVTTFVKYLLMTGPLAFVIPVLVFIVLRIIYILKVPLSQKNNSSFDSTFLVFSAGCLGIGMVISLCYLYQIRFGSLYLHIGIISSVFMVGLTFGAILIRHLLSGERKTRSQILLFSVILVHSLILSTIAFWPSHQWTHLIFGIAFVLCGLCTGCYFPLAARGLADSGFEAGQAGSKLEMADHLGASVGGLLTSLVLVPVLGTKLTILIFILFILANTPAAVLKIYMPEKICSIDTIIFRLRRLGYILFGIGVCFVLCSNLLAEAGAKLRPSLPQYAAQALAGELNIKQESTVGGDIAGKIDYFRVCDANDKLTGYIFSSEDLAPEIRGFGGKMNLGIHVNTTGRLINFHIIKSNETPAYLNLLSQPDANDLTWYAHLNGSKLFQPQPFADVHSVTGATVSSEAILSSIQTSAHKFASQVLGQSLEPKLKEKTRLANLTDTQGIYLIGAFALALIVTYRGGFWSRLAVLCLNLVVGGIILNTQYSSEQIASILSIQTPVVGLSGAFLLVIGIPILIIFFGNIFCGYICPFGALQELLGYFIPKRFKPMISIETMQKARFVKYGILLVVIIVFFSSRNRTTLAADPLISIFNFQFWGLSIFGPLLLIVTMALIGSVFYTRFWCRYLCFVGAFLSLFNKVVILKRYVPAKKFGMCEFGLTGKDQMDCIYCDRCRYQVKATVKNEHLPRPHHASTKAMSRYFVVGVLITALLISTVSVNRFSKVIGADIGKSAGTQSAGGEPRDVDLQRIRTMIEQNRLSDHEAEFYKKAEQR
ncbi:MAG: 4Fe-4S binding protein [Phycisphaerae bacterium]|nr:4Fe-4S binding protein [Phycisphaerae bacterium]NIP53999.1 4Fe-4S binding protein [Phycisphaerae bacterium]NIS51308.1 4Fe-4S binding protein [Phycisphaerae bacterium]NIU10401.1 4Fe-4S binding protein [Phycisphaerae bacterium]NIU58099.1 4Fe-4S binding protein [Phycisphaerae bacterium]